MGMSVHNNGCVNRAVCDVCDVVAPPPPPPTPPADPAPRTWCQQDDGGDDQRANDQNDKKGDRYSLPVPLRRVTAHQLLQRDREEERKGMVRDSKKDYRGRGSEHNLWRRNEAKMTEKLNRTICGTR